MIQFIRTNTKPAALLSMIALLWGLAILNVFALRNVGTLPLSHHTPDIAASVTTGDNIEGTIVEQLNGYTIRSQAMLALICTQHSTGDTVSVTTRNNRAVTTVRDTLVPKHSAFDILSYFCIGSVFLIFAGYIAIRHRNKKYSFVLYSVTVGTAVMILFDWGSADFYHMWFTYVLRVLFDCAIWFVPVLFLHFSFVYPYDKTKSKYVVLIPWYAIASAGCITTIWFLTALTYGDFARNASTYILFHSFINDGFLITGLLWTIGNLEHSALTITNAAYRKNVYWILLGVTFGPMVYVFLMLIPRMLLGFELVSQSVMQYALLMAPLMFWKVIR